MINEHSGYRRFKSVLTRAVLFVEVLVDDLDSAVVAAHRASTFVSRIAGAALLLGELWIDGEFHLAVPVEDFARLGHLEVPFARTRHAAHEVSGMGGDAARDDARVDILDRRQRQVLGRGDVAEEVRAGDSGERAAVMWS